MLSLPIFCTMKFYKGITQKYRENDPGWRTSNPKTSLTQFQLAKRIPYGA